MDLSTKITTDIGRVEDILMVVDSGASWCNVVDRFLLEELKK